MIDLNIAIFERGTGGAPTLLLVDNLQDRIDSYTHTISDRFGFESMTVQLRLPLDEAAAWLTSGLMRSAVVYDPDGQIAWEGYLRSITAQIGQKQIAISLDDMANRVKCIYTTVLDTRGTTAASSDTTSQGLYGVKDLVVSLAKDTATAAANKATTALAAYAFPRTQAATQAATGSQGDVQITFDFEGWYGTLSWVVFSRTSTSNTAISTQIGALIGTSSPGIGATNAFLSTSTINMISVANTATEFAEAETPYREKIEELLEQGTGTYPVAWGVYENREFYIQTWAGATPEVVTYYEPLGDAHIYDTYGNIIPPWRVRPNAIAQITEFLDIAPTATAPDAASRRYIGRVTCTISGETVGVTLEPPNYQGIDAILAARR